MSELHQSGIQVIEVRIRNFRSLRWVDVTLDSLTVLIGENNAGKTSFLDALFAAIGAGRRVITAEDVYLAPKETKVPKDRVITVDLLIRPADANGKIIDSFPTGSYWLELWGNAVSQDANDNDLVAIRTQLKWDATRGEYVTERKFLNDWQTDPKKWEESRVKEKAGTVSAAHIEPLALYYLDAKRDIQEELHGKSSSWSKMVSDPGLTDEQVERLENALTDLNDDIVANSAVLVHVQDHLNDIYKTVAGEQGAASITPVPRHLRDLTKGMDVSFSTQGAQAFPIVRHGMGTRSLGAIMTFRAYTTWRQKISKTDVIHPMLALEEPEAHLHPQAQRALYRQIEQIPGQRIVSTHSPYIAAQADISTFRYFRKDGADTTVTRLDTREFSGEDIRKIERMVMNTRGDVLYARAVVLFEGETEEQALPIFAEKYWGRHPNDLGITLVGVGGVGNYLPFLRLFSNFVIPWYILSDGEPGPLKAVRAALNQIGVPDYSVDPRVVVLPEGMNFESYLVSEKYIDALTTMLDSYHKQTDYLDQEFIPVMEKQKGKNGSTKDYRSEGGRERALIDALSLGKTRYGSPVAHAIIALDDEARRFPPKIRSLLEKVSSDLGLPKKEATA